MTRILSDDHDAGIVELFHYDDDTDEVTIETVQDVEDLVDQNKRCQNAVTSLDRHGDWSRVASIPMSVYWDLKRQGILDDEAALKRWLNDPGNRVFRTRVGVV